MASDPNISIAIALAASMDKDALTALSNFIKARKTEMATSSALAVPEIVEQILKNLPLIDLFKAMMVNKKFRAVVLGSLTLRHAMFFEHRVSSQEHLSAPIGLAASTAYDDTNPLLKGNNGILTDFGFKLTKASYSGQTACKLELVFISTCGERPYLVDEVIKSGSWRLTKISAYPVDVRIRFTTGQALDSYDATYYAPLQPFNAMSNPPLVPYYTKKAKSFELDHEGAELGNLYNYAAYMRKMWNALKGLKA